MTDNRFGEDAYGNEACEAAVCMRDTYSIVH